MQEYRNLEPDWSAPVMKSYLRWTVFPGDNSTFHAFKAGYLSGINDAYKQCSRELVDAKP